MERAPENQVRPISPEEALQERLRRIPDSVLSTFNELIMKNATIGGRSALIRQKEVMERLVALGMDRREIYANHWLDVEPLYEEVGWKVKYDSPSYGDDDFEPYFQFTKK